MDISGLNGYNQMTGETGIKSKQKEKIDKDKKSRFDSQLNKATQKADLLPGLKGDEELAELMDELFKNGEDLVNDPSMVNLRAYRSSVSLFFKFVINESLVLKSTPGKLNTKTMQREDPDYLINVIDRKIDALAESILGDQRKQFDILGRVEEINGLIVDLIS